MSSRAGSARVPSSSTVTPFTDTRPLTIRVSAARLDETPAAERIFWRRSPVGASFMSVVSSQ